MNEAVLLLMIRRFPTLSRQIDICVQEEQSFKPMLDVLPFLRTTTGSSGARAAKAFLLHLWDRANPFDLKSAWGSWDEEHREAFFACMREV
jgi:hypothetical protein